MLGLAVICYIHLLAGSGGWGNQYRPQGELIYLGLVGWLLFADKLNFSVHKYGTFALYSLVGLVISALLIGPREDWRYIGVLGEPNALAAASLFYLTLVMQLSGYKKWLGVFLSVLLVIATGSRGGVLGICLMVLWIVGWRFIS